MALSHINPEQRPLSMLLDGLTDGAVPSVDVAGVAIDSRAVTPGSLFMAYAGTRAHGLDFVDQAVANGARAIAWDGDHAPDTSVPAIRVPELAARASAIAGRFFGRPAERLFVAGITGTDGKTSCAWMLARALEELGVHCGYIGTLGAGLPDDLAEATHTTPDPVVVQQWLARLVADAADAVAFEVSSHALHQHRVDGVAFDVAVLTQIGRDHLDYHGDLAAYARAKRRLFEFAGLKYAVLNADDAFGRAWLDALDASVTPIVYGRGDVASLAACHVAIESIETRIDGVVLEVSTHAGSARIESGLVGEFNAMNLAAVLAVLLARGETLTDAAAALAAIDTVPGRMQRIDARVDQPLVVVDFAHTPGALAQALGAVRAHAEGRVLCVFGCGGDRDRGKRALMGQAAVAGADAVWVTDDNPRSESPQAIVDEILAGIADRTAVQVVHDRGRAIAAAIAAAGVGDVVLIAGKGHETTQQIGSERRPFDDRIEARRALEAA
ncbi:UDP-N-acetylmuramoyl-L-alanyl-D-glutamate--2,6-diaminopimelate ligase [Salinisphaera aquimarina]|uniref:UDP-N-acetylmuramoyl-L-alanyl-D-glutamate--2,6-diaminopimelate ligase n=1 Tax=Salinisphaera aquimarina TaxID=2094031 RepID=A0ABV7EL66_9GAMM